MRGKQARKRILVPDPVYKSERVTKFINYIMLDGKKEKARTIVYTAIEIASKKVGEEPMTVFEKVLGAVKPEVEVRSRRVGGATFQIPLPVPRGRSESLAMRWIIDAARSRSGKPMSDRLAEELTNAFNGEGVAVKKREDTHKMADANRAFAHFKW
ncbi:30S ribosomal protein S7 [candidate division WWE3 bacterium CG_4_10_14_0_2_um_filter_41_14]|uniref:Small ribosomal subunit protein uS7 n=1 Tax=candidate division WWE3 bacterium CG_4_10_14_0_2_um_filter_41_14 TaxID=1975072 RepID=A0A2M7TLT0_UNCKA|nr:MAG: 30S ribosomal protein S7 [candidate division WWE3 bacterium CG_4_10_14_0_2_um_filter_41_14]